MNNWLLGIWFSFLSLLTLAGAANAYEVLHLPAVKSHLAVSSQLFGIAAAGDRLVATGIRGHIILSDDFGQSWRQARSVPVRSDLLDVTFINQNEGWAVGHDSVILHTVDGGENWEKQFDGLDLGVKGVAFYNDLLAEAEEQLAVCTEGQTAASIDIANAEDCEKLSATKERYETLIFEMEFAAKQGADKPFFGIVCYDFEGSTQCNAGGAYGLNYRTEDHGKSWIPALENVDNPEFGHLFQAAVIDENTFIVGGEMGTVWVIDKLSRSWKLIKLNYEGSIFTVVAGEDKSLLAGGLRGNLFRSIDNGKTWTEPQKPKMGTLIDAVRLRDGRIVFVSQNGQAIISNDNGATFSDIKIPNRYGFVSLIESRPGELVIVGNKGPSVVKLDKE